VRGVLRREALLQSLMAGHCWLWAVVVAIKLLSSVAIVRLRHI
jgi:hypothetical protein